MKTYMKRYELIADELADSIRRGLLKPGDKLSSVRKTSQLRGVSPSTVFQAYYLLEAKGLIRASERSGYYVASTIRHQLPEPETPPRNPPSSSEVDISSLVFDILASTRSRDVVPLGSAFPSPLQFPFRDLGRALNSAQKQQDPWASIDDLTPGNAQLRRQIALRYLVEGMTIHTDDIIITNGAMEALNLCLFALTRPGDSVVIESPAFYGSLQALERLGLKAVEVSTHPREGIDLAALEQAIQMHRPRACWLMSSFQNPLGASMNEAKKRELVAILNRHQLPMIEDDVYGELHFSKHRPLPVKAYDSQGLVLHCSSFSKSLAPGYRVGWAMPGKFTEAVARHKLTTSIAASAPAQAALANYLQKPAYDRHLRLMRQNLALQQNRMHDAIARYFPSGTRATRPAGGYFLWLELPPGTDALALHRHAISQGISVAPGPMFTVSHDFRHCLRLNYGHPDDRRIDTALQTLGKLAERFKG